MKFQFGYIPNLDYHINFSSFETNLSHLQDNAECNVQYRMVVMQEIRDNISYIVEKFCCYKIDNIELLSYHNLSDIKYKQLNKTIHNFNPPDKNVLEQLINSLHESNINESVLNI